MYNKDYACITGVRGVIYQRNFWDGLYNILTFIFTQLYCVIDMRFENNDTLDTVGTQESLEIIVTYAAGGIRQDLSTSQKR